MTATLKLPNGKEITVTVTEEQVKELEKSKKTGYEKAPFDYFYWYFDGCAIDKKFCNGDKDDRMLYEYANCYSDKTVAENNARADTLMRKLRRFAVEHREHELDWKRSVEMKYQINYAHSDGTFHVWKVGSVQTVSTMYFDSEETANAAIEEFKDELIWYFTEYKDSL